MLLIDKNTTPTSPTSLFLTREEFKEVYPHLLTGRKSYIFKYDQPKEVPKEEGELLLRKYSHLEKWDKRQVPTDRNRFAELDKINYKDLKKMAGKLGLGYIEMRVKKPILINSIIAKEDK